MSRKTKCKNCGETCYWVQDSLDRWVLLNPENVTYDQANQGDRILVKGKVIVVNKQISIPAMTGNVLHNSTCKERIKPRKGARQNEVF